MLHPFASQPETIQSLIHLGFGDQERRADAEHVSVEAADANEQAFLLGGLEKGFRCLWCGFFGAWIMYDFERPHESHAER